MRVQRAEVDVTHLRGEMDTKQQMLVPTRIGHMYSDMMQQREREERVVWEASYYRGLYHGVVPPDHRATSYRESVHSHRTYNQCLTQSQQIGGSVGMRPPRMGGEGDLEEEEGARETGGES